MVMLAGLYRLVRGRPKLAVVTASPLTSASDGKKNLTMSRVSQKRAIMPVSVHTPGLLSPTWQLPLEVLLLGGRGGQKRSSDVQGLVGQHHLCEKYPGGLDATGQGAAFPNR